MQSTSLLAGRCCTVRIVCVWCCTVRIVCVWASGACSCALHLQSTPFVPLSAAPGGNVAYNASGVIRRAAGRQDCRQLGHVCTSRGSAVRPRQHGTGGVVVCYAVGSTSGQLCVGVCGKHSSFTWFFLGGCTRVYATECMRRLLTSKRSRSKHVFVFCVWCAGGCSAWQGWCGFVCVCCGAGVYVSAMRGLSLTAL